MSSSSSFPLYSSPLVNSNHTPNISSAKSKKMSNLDSKRSGKAPERSNFVSTCNLLSQYLKEKGNLKDLNRQINGQLSTTGKSEASRNTRATTKNLPLDILDLNQPPIEETTFPMDKLPKLEDPSNKATTSKEATQMTIFYEGKIWVFDDLSADNAQEVMKVATMRSSSSAIVNLSTSGTDNTSSGMTRDPNFSSEKLKQLVQRQLDANDSVIPIARRSSLHRFLGKRKERSVTRGPNQIQEELESSSKNDVQLELRL